MHKKPLLRTILVCTVTILLVGVWGSSGYAMSDSKAIKRAEKAIASLNKCSTWAAALAKDMKGWAKWTKDNADNIQDWIDDVPDDQLAKDMSKRKAKAWRKAKDHISKQIKQYKKKCAGVTKAIENIIK